MKTKILFIPLLALLLFGTSCDDKKELSKSDSTPPSPPTNITYEPLFGGARFFYTIPDDENLLSVDAEYTNEEGKTFYFSSSYFVDSLDVIGFGDTLEYNVSLYSKNRAGIKSDKVNMTVIPLEPAISRVVSSLELKPGFSSFFIDWNNELEQSINIYIDFSFIENGTPRNFTTVFSSNLKQERRFVEDLHISPDTPVKIKIRVTDFFGNQSDVIDMGEIYLLEDTKIPKDNWLLPETNDSVAGVPQAFGNEFEGRTRYVIDGIIDDGVNMNFMVTGGRGRTGNAAHGNMPWNIIIDLGDYYELSRIVTHQRQSNFTDGFNRGQYYRGENVGIYQMYILNEETNMWEYLSEHKIEVPEGLSDLEIIHQARQGDMAYMYPDDPQYTRPTRWFRYRAMKSFHGNYTLENANCLSEITLYGRKASK